MCLEPKIVKIFKTCKRETSLGQMTAASACRRINMVAQKLKQKTRIMLMILMGLVKLQLVVVWREMTTALQIRGE